MSHSLPLRIAKSDPIPSDPPRFVVAGQIGTASGDVKLYEWHRERGDMRLAGLQTDAGQIRAMEWSPSPTHRNLVAVGLSTGRTLLLNLSPQTLSLPLNTATSVPNTPTATISILPIRHVRATTSIAFSPVDHNYMATGYEKHRSDYSLLIWDLSTALAATPPDNDSAWQRPLDRLEVTNALARDLTRLNPSEPRHIQHYCQGEHVNDVAFLTTCYTLLASANNKTIRLYDLRSPGTGSATPKDPTSASAAGATGQFNTRAVFGLTPDPNQEGRFASYETSPGGTLSTVRLWDSRKPVGDVASFEIRSAVSGLEWISGGAGHAKLGVATRDGVSMVDVTDGREVTDNGVDEWTTVGDIRNVVKPKHHLHACAFSNSVDKRRSDVLFVVKDGTIGIGPVAPTPTHASSSRGGVVIASSQLGMIDPDSEETHPEIEDPADEASDNEDEFVRSNKFQLDPSRVNDILAEASRSRTGSPTGSNSRPGKLRKPGREIAVRMSDDVREGSDLGWDGWRRVLRADVGCVMRRRAEEGYGLGNMLLNAAIATRYPGHDRLAGIWEFLDHFVNVMDPDTSVTRSTNLTYAGIHSIWTGQDLAQAPLSPTSNRSQSTSMSEIGRAPSQASAHHEPVKQGSAAWTSLRNNQLPTRSHTTPITTPSPASATPEKIMAKPLPDADFAAAVEHINARRDTEGHPGRVGRARLPPTDKAAQRRMILSVCGEREAGEVNRLVEDDGRTKAASWAYFSGDEENAVRILMNSSNSKHRLLGTTLAGFLSQTRSTRQSDSSFFDEHWRSLINRVDDPYIRAVLSRVGGDEWDTVLQEEAIPLLDRTAIAVCNVSDDELTAFLRNRLNRFTRNPSPWLSSLSFTGFTAPSIALLQRWLERTGDIQTVALLSAYFPMSRLNSGEREVVKRWNESYRDLLDCWGMWGQRVEYDIGRMEVGRGLGERRTADGEDARGVCPVCNNVLSTVHEEHLQLKSGLSREKTLPNERTGGCTLCGQILPRCVICLRHVEARFSSAHAHDQPDNELHDDFNAAEGHLPSDTIEQAYICCLTCRHGDEIEGAVREMEADEEDWPVGILKARKGDREINGPRWRSWRDMGHANHILPWFQGGLDGEGGHDVCPVAGCPCECANI